MESLSRQLEERADRLARASVEWMYEDPFWEARYGIERARRFGGEDAQFHVRYLVQALREQQTSVMEGYAQWLRTLLCSRGMCSLHLDQNFAGLQAALATEGFGPNSPAHAYVQAARDALRYTAGPARTLQERAAELARRTTRALSAEVPASLQSRLEAELLLHLSYLQDAVGLQHPEFFERHVEWYQGFWPRRELGVLPFPRLLEALAAELPDPEAIQAVLGPARISKEKHS
ncbi:hypothetical protein [Hyalangium versicolor]|uniref:hypothetical protein n=1 Tax=Hyalangium versicolor TaxID=2861190 RepID=UPI001CCF50F8|nr:hypothetical protein [Hyalangium versicolor]